MATFGHSKQNTEYNYICVENYVYKKLKEAVEIYKNQTKNHSVLAKMYKVYIICTPKCDAFGNRFLSFTKHNGMLQAKQMTNVLFSLLSIAQYAHRFRII